MAAAYKRPTGQAIARRLSGGKDYVNPVPKRMGVGYNDPGHRKKAGLTLEDIRNRRRVGEQNQQLRTKTSSVGPIKRTPNYGRVKYT